MAIQAHPWPLPKGRGENPIPSSAQTAAGKGAGTGIKAKLLVFGSLALSLIGIGVPIFCVAAHAAPNADGVSATPVLDPDGDDMRYHWQNPAYAQEQVAQMAGIGAIMLSLAGIGAVKRLRRNAIHAPSRPLPGPPLESERLKDPIQ